MGNTWQSPAHLVLVFIAGVGLGLLLASTLTTWSPGVPAASFLSLGQQLKHARAGLSNFAPISLTLPHGHYMNSSQIKWELIGNSTVPEGAMPLSLKAFYPRHTLPNASSVLPIHWVIKSCTRQRYGRVFTTTLLSGLFNGLQPATISIAWCKPFNKDSPLPSLFYNLRHSLSINVFYPPEEWGDWESTTALLALMVPQLLGAPHVPLFVTEDDIIFAPDANARIAAAVREVHQGKHSHIYNATDTYMMTFYNGDIKTFNRSQPPDIDAIQTQPDDFKQPIIDSSALVHSVTPLLVWGAQAHLYTPNMTQLLYNHFKQVHAAIKAKNTTSQFWEWGQALNDIITLWAMEKHYKCNQPGSGCHAFVVQPNLVQHSGMLSSYTNGDVPSNWASEAVTIHLTPTFPMHVRFATSDNSTAW